MKLYLRDAKGIYTEACEEIVLSAARQVISRRFCVGTRVVDPPRQAGEYVRMVLTRNNHTFGLMYLDAHHRLIDIEPLGVVITPDTVNVSTRVVVKAVLAHNAAAVLSFHKRSHSCEPTAADDAVILRLKEALVPVDVAFLDHLIVGQRVYSFAQKGRLALSTGSGIIDGASVGPGSHDLAAHGRG